MRVIICGAGQVGYSIAEYLAREDNDITVIDTNAQLIARVSDELDVNGIVGHASNPDVLSRAAAGEADMIIAVTHSDEINMVACQVAHSLFNVPRKIARIREQAYLDPAWANLFARAHMPIDVIISPEIEVARAINQRLLIPGTTNVITLADGKIYLAGVICGPNCPVIHTQIHQITGLFPALKLRIAAILRGGAMIVPSPHEELLPGDEVYFFAEAGTLRRAMAVFGHEEKEARHIIVMGGGNVGRYLVDLMHETQKDVSIKVIEYNPERARILSEAMPYAIVINGDALSQEILEEANVGQTETLVAVTNDDETNILGSLLAKQYGCERVITLVNRPAYGPLMSSLGIDAVVTPRSSTVARIMQNVRRGRIRALHTLRDGLAEVIEAEVSETVALANQPVGMLDLPEGVVIGAILHNGQPVDMTPDTVIRPGDRVITLAVQEQARKVEKMFSVQVDLF